MLEEIIKHKSDIFLIFETKLDSFLPVGQFITKDYSTVFRLDRNQNNRGLLLYVHEDFPCKTLNEYISEKPIKKNFGRSKLKIEEMAPIMFIRSKYKINS